jgi:hypothetical protein
MRNECLMEFCMDVGAAITRLDRLRDGVRVTSEL